MSLPIDDRRREWPGNGVTVTFNGPNAYEKEHLFVYLLEAGVLTLVDPSQWNVKNLGRNNGSRVTMVTPPTGTQTLVILRTVPVNQLTDITNQGAFLPETLEKALDYQAMISQQLEDGVNRSLRFGDNVVPAPSNILPPAVVGLPLVFDVDGSLITGSSVLTGDMALRPNLAADTGSSLLGFKQSGAGTVARTVQDKLRERLSLLDFPGVDVTGVADSTAALVAAYAEAKARRVNLYLPPGTLKISSTLTWDGDVSVIGEGGATNYGCTLLSWAGAAGGKMIDIVGRHYGLQFDRIAIEGNNTLGTGFQIDRLQNCTIGTLAVFRTTVDAFLIKPNEEFSNDNFMFNDITALYCDTFAGNGLRLDSFTATSNCCHNTFHTMGLTIRNGVAKKALVLGDTDNNSFLMTYTALLSSDGSSYGCELLAAARSNYFWQFQGSIIARAGSKNAVFGFDRENGQPQPTVEATASLFWTEVGNNAQNWNMTVPLAKLAARLVGNIDLSATVPSDSFFDIAHPATGGRLRMGFSNVGAANVGASMRIYSSKDGVGFALPAIQFENDSIIQFRVGGKAHTYGPSIPAAGTWGVGDIAYNTAPTAGGFVGWVCVTAGTPGTWKGFGTIAP